MAYAMSLDDGRSFGPALPLVKQGPEYSPEHPFDGLRHGKNQVYGIYEPLFLEDGRFLVPLELSVLEVDDKTIYNPLGWDFSQIVGLIGKRAGEACVWDSSRPACRLRHAVHAGPVRADVGPPGRRPRAHGHARLQPQEAGDAVV